MQPISLNRMSARIARPVIQKWSRRLRLVSGTWDDLTAELDLWPTGQVRIWWRDDDATTYTLQLNRLLALSDTCAVPVALAVIPSFAGRALPACLRGRQNVVVLAHGWSHHNHAQRGRPAAELADRRAPRQVHDELSKGRMRLEDLFATQFRPVQVPPHNFIAAALVPAVAQAGFRYLSVDRDLTGLQMPSRNIHVDVIDWKHNRAVERAGLLRQLLTALRLRRYGLVNASLPIGLLTHHLVHDTEIWALTETLLRHLADHSAVSFPTVDEVFPPTRQPPSSLRPAWLADERHTAE